jgi:hypothetical protein
MTSLASSCLRDLAIRLLAAEAGNGEGSQDAAALKVCGKLGDLLSDLAGSEGHRSLFTRALSMARADVAWLSQISVDADGSLQGMECRSEVSRNEVIEGETLLIAHILGLLGVFIGEPLVLQLVREIWPVIYDQQDLATKARNA